MYNQDTLIFDVVLEHPEAEKVFKNHGIRCFGWGGFAYKSIGYAARVFRIDPKELIEEITTATVNKGVWLFMSYPFCAVTCVLTY